METEGKDKLIDNKKKMLIKLIVYLSVFLLMFLITLIFINRVSVFIKMYKAEGSKLQLVGLGIYFFVLVALICFYATLLVYILIKYKKKEDWYNLVSLIGKKADIGIFVGKCFTFLLFIMVFFLNPCTVSGDSMLNTFKTGDKILCSNAFYTPKRGDVITFDASDYDIQGKKSFYIKRVVALGKDEISYDFTTNVFYVNGKEEKRQHVTSNQFNVLYQNIVGEEIEEGALTAKCDVPKHKIVVMGDNRGESWDSRMFGPIDENDVFGKVIIRFSPITRFEFF